jgi:hypothetical protein
MPVIIEVREQVNPKWLEICPNLESRLFSNIGDINRLPYCLSIISIAINRFWSVSEEPCTIGGNSGRLGFFKLSLEGCRALSGFLPCVECEAGQESSGNPREMQRQVTRIFDAITRKEKKLFNVVSIRFRQ